MMDEQGEWMLRWQQAQAQDRVAADASLLIVLQRIATALERIADQGAERQRDADAAAEQAAYDRYLEGKGPKPR